MVTAMALTGYAAEPLRPVQTIPLSGVAGRIDHMAADLIHKRLFVAALGNNTLEVIDLTTGARTHSIAGLHEPQGIAYVPDRNQIYVANGGDGKLQVFDAVSFGLVESADLSADADNVRYYAQARQIFVGYASGALGVFDATNGQKLGDIPLKGHPESFQLERAGPHIFVNVPTAGHVAVVDREKRTVITQWPLTNQANFPMALDEAGHRLFVGCRKPPHVAVFDTSTGKAVARLDCVGDTDDLFYDAALKRLYVSGGEGFLTVIREQDASHFLPLARIPTAPGARTSLFVADLRRLYLAVPQREAQGAEIRVFETHQ